VFQRINPIQDQPRTDCVKPASPEIKDGGAVRDVTLLRSWMITLENFDDALEASNLNLSRGTVNLF